MKSELKAIIKSIPEDGLYGSSIKNLWQRYCPDVSYGTFRQYLKIFKSNKIKEINSKTQLQEVQIR